MNTWISVKNCLPKLHQEVLLHHMDGTIEIGCRFTFGFMFTDVWGKVTHWMPLPPSP